MLSFVASAKTAFNRIALRGSGRHVRALNTSVAVPNKSLFGFGRELNDTPEYPFGFDRPQKRLRFPNALEDWGAEPLTLRERAMMAMMESVVCKTDWQRKVFDESICARWRAEIQSEDFTEKMYDYCITELRDNTHFFRHHGFVPVLDANATLYVGDGYIDNDIRRALQHGVSNLENKPAEAKDWHPRSDEKVLNLVHPSLFPLVYGRTRAIVGTRNDENKIHAQLPWKGEVIPVPHEVDCMIAKFCDIGQSNDTQYYSQRFQWLPCDVHFERGDKVRIASYINNLHPHEHQALYGTIEKIIAKAVPLWDETLSSLGSGPPGSSDAHHRITITEIVLDELAMSKPRPPEDNEDELEDFDKELLDAEWHEENYVIVPPEPGDYNARSRARNASNADFEKVNLRRDFGEEGLQIIVKLSSIHLTPDKPAYEGGSWHVEGQLNEHICATALYYYDSHNIADSYLAFREGVNEDAYEDLPYEHGQMRWIEDFYGFKNNVPHIQELGHVLAKEGRLLTFPNVLQHRIESFRLADSSKGGHRKVLALFLVDPYLRIPSTSIVPPQQKEWWEKGLPPTPIFGLAPETERDIFQEGSDALMDLTEAKELRLELMAERTAFVKDTETPHLMAETNLCEH